MTGQPIEGVLPVERVIRETAFAGWATGTAVRLSPQEHDAYEWVSVPQALSRLPFEGLREAVRRAAR